MNSRSLLNLGLLILIGILAAFALWEPGKEELREPERLTDLNPADIDRVRIERRGQVTVAAERDEAGNWLLTEPRGIPASGHRFDSLLKVAEAAIQRRFPVQGDLEEYGLSEPRVRLQLNEVTLSFGGTTPVDHRRYVRRDDSIYLIGDTHYYHLIGEFGTFASHRLLPENAGLEAISLPDLELHQREGRWLMRREAANISADAVSQLVNNWQYARAIEVKNWDAPTPEGEAIRISLAGENAPVEFLIASREPQAVLVRPDWGLAYHLPDSVAEGLFSLPEPPNDETGN